MNTKVGYRDDLAARALRAIPGGVNSAQRNIPGLDAIIVGATSGATFTDVSGRVYTDYHGAFGPQVLGHNDPDVDRAVSETARRVDLLGAGVTAEEVELAELLIDCVPSIERVLLTVTGSEATFHALRLARAVTGRRLVAKFQGCYHGWHDSVAMNVISPADMVGRKDPLSKGILSEVIDSTIVLPFNDISAVRRAVEMHSGEIAAIILEPIPHNIGAVLPQREFLVALREITKSHGIVLVFDEVITGFRHGLGGYQGIVGVTPDLTTLGKAMANGYPISALGGRSDLMDQFSSRPGAPTFFAGTFNGHPAMVAAALATIRKLRDEPVHDHIFRLGARARSELAEMYKRLDVPAVVAGYGSVFLTYFLDGPVVKYEDLLRNDAELFVAYRKELMSEGIFELPLNLKRSHISYAHRDSDIDVLIPATEKAVVRVLERRSMTSKPVTR
jgi:glutamate-1-semialdehyde 2,1-aminomutase